MDDKIINLIKRLEIPEGIKNNILDNIDNIDSQQLLQIVHKYWKKLVNIRNLNRYSKINAKNQNKKYDQTVEEYKDRNQADALLDLI